MLYQEIKDLINSTLQGKHAGHEITPLEHQNILMAVLEYAHEIEIEGQSILEGLADVGTVPKTPENRKICYIALCASGTISYFTSFDGYDGNPISVSCEPNEVKFVILLWNKEYWEKIEQSLTI